MSPELILASTSPYRRALLEKLGLPFRCADPAVDETPLPHEPPVALVRRLAEAKARAVAQHYPEGLIIGGDQLAVCEGEILGKPGNHARAVAQLRRIGGKAVVFQTALCLYQPARQRLWLEVVPYTVYFRPLDDALIERYLAHEPAYNCAGSFKSEGFGITLCERLEGDDPNALVGLPLIRLTRMLEEAGVQVI